MSTLYVETVMPWEFDEDNTVTEVIKWFGSQIKAAERLGVSTTLLVCRRREGQFTPEEAVLIEELSKGEFSRSYLRPDMWPKKHWKRDS